MSQRDRKRLPEELGEIAERLRDQRPEATPIELDRIKLRAMRSRRPGLISRKGNGFMRKPALSLVLVIGMLGGGTGALAAVGGVPVDLPFQASSHDNGASNSQYCPPTSQNPGALKKPGFTNCGNPKTKVPPGLAKKLDGGNLPPGLAKKFGHANAGNGPGNGHGHGNGPGNGNGGGNGHGNGGNVHANSGGGGGNGHGNGGGNGHGKGGGKK
jgi:hypothetical protein